MAALRAGRAGARVVCCEEDFGLGGRCLAEDVAIGDLPAAQWVKSVEAELAALPNVRIMPRTTVIGVYDGRTYGALQRVSDHLLVPVPGQPRQRFWRIIAKHSVLAAGAIERPLVFGDNDRPGIMLAGSVRTYVNRFAVRPGARAVVFTNNDDAWRTLSALKKAGIAIQAIVDPRPATDAGRRSAEQAQARLVTGVVTRVSGGRQLRAVHVTATMAPSRRFRAISSPCRVAGIDDPFGHTFGRRPAWDDTLAAFVPGRLPSMTVVGAAAGKFAWRIALSTEPGGWKAVAAGYRLAREGS